MTVNANDKKRFLEKDLYDSLRWLVEGAIAWESSCQLGDGHRHQRAFSMFTSLVQARALYEFYFDPKSRSDDARAFHFARNWNGHAGAICSAHLGPGKPSNKRIFHLVYEREKHAGGPGHDGPNHLKNQVKAIAIELLDSTKTFIRQVDTEWKSAAQGALDNALLQAVAATHAYGIGNDFL